MDSLQFDLGDAGVPRCGKCDDTGRVWDDRLGAERPCSCRVPEPQPRARTTDPGTSHAAAASVTNLKDSQAAVMRVLREYGPMTDEAIRESYEAMMARGAEIPKQSDSGLRTRRAELVDLGLVTDTGERRKLTSGRMSIVWAAAA